MPSSVAIIICTRDRAESLRATLAAIGRCAVPADLAAELFVVDNGSTDDTAAVVRQCKLSNLSVRYLLEPQPGQVRARNAGMRAAGGADIILFTDDDVRPPLGWIEGMCRPILSGATDAVLGGVHFPARYETLLSREPFRSRRGWFAGTDGIDRQAPNRLVGANMSFSRQVVKTLGDFDPELGPGALGFYDDTVWSLRLLAAGLRIVAGAPEVSVEHHFDRSRLTRATLLNMAERMGQSAAWASYHWHQDEARVAALKRWWARGWLWLARGLTPWRAWFGSAPSWELQRVQTQAFFEALVRYAGQPRKYRGP